VICGSLRITSTDPPEARSLQGVEVDSDLLDQIFGNFFPPVTVAVDSWGVPKLTFAPVQTSVSGWAEPIGGSAPPILGPLATLYPVALCEIALCDLGSH
jgi:hypothetical protein